MAKKYLDHNGLDYLWSKLKTLLAGKAEATHEHSATDITSGTFSVARGGTGRDSVTSGNYLVGNGTNAMQEMTPAEVLSDIGAASESYVDEVVSANYNESIIGLSVDGRTVTYIKGDGSVHTFETQDTDTTYSLGTDTTTGLTKLYATTGSAEDGTMTQKAIKTELDKKVGVAIDAAQNTLTFTV